MQQTLFALLSMLIMTLLAFNQQRALIETKQAMLNDEMEVMASGIALQAMEYIGAKSFDEGVKAEGVPASQPTLLGGTSVSLNRLSAQMPSNRACTVLPQYEDDPGYDVCDDLSDFNGMRPQQVPFGFDGGEVAFQVSATVRYVNEQRQPVVGAATRHKEVVVQVEQYRASDRAYLHLKHPVTLSRTFSIP